MIIRHRSLTAAQLSRTPRWGPFVERVSMNSFGKQQGGGRRSAARSAAPIMAVLTTLSGSRSAVLSNVSSTGARFRATDLPQMGEELQIRIDRIQAFGTVVWSEHGECGVVFDAPLHPGEEQTLRETVAAALGLPADMRAAFDNWVVGCGR